MINAFMLIITLFFTSTIFFLSLISGNIDFEAKKGLHLIHGCAKNIFDSRVLFQVWICGLEFSLLFYKNFFFYYYYYSFS
jgi:hypothetical protein